jgi:hypothetical protein
MGVPPKTPGLIAFEGLFELYNRSGRLLPDPLKTSFQNVLPKRPLKISFQSFLQTVYSYIIDSHIIDLPPTIYLFIPREKLIRVVIVSIFRSTTKFLKIQDKPQVNKSQEYIKAYLFFVLAFRTYFSHLLFVPAFRTCLIYYTFLDMVYQESEIKPVLLVCLLSRSRVTPTSKFPP